MIKFTKKAVNAYYNKELNDDKDYCIYIDTDSVFFSAVPLLDNRFPNEKLSDIMKTQRISEIATEVQTYMNSSYNYSAKKFCNLDKHRFDIKQEVIAKSGLFVTKKRYALKIINDNGVKVNKTMVKGLDTVRSNFPNAMRGLMNELLEDILLDENITDRLKIHIIAKKRVENNLSKTLDSSFKYSYEKYFNHLNINSLKYKSSPFNIGEK